MLQTTRFGIGVQELDDFIARAIILISKSINRTQKDRKMQVLPWKAIFSSAYYCTSLQKVEKRINHRWNCPKLCRMSVGNVLDRKRTTQNENFFRDGLPPMPAPIRLQRTSRITTHCSSCTLSHTLSIFNTLSFLCESSAFFKYFASTWFSGMRFGMVWVLEQQKTIMN